MAEQAQKEPTMEEILASIRKIISEDDGAPVADDGATARLKPEDLSELSEAKADDVFDLDSLAAPRANDDDMFEEVGFEPAAVAEETPHVELEPETQTALDDLVDEPISDFGVEEEPFEAPEAFETPEPIEFAEPVEEPEPVEMEAVLEIASEPEPELVEEFEFEIEETVPELEPEPAEPMRPDMSPAAALTEETTADAAAGALARLVSKMDMGSEHTLEGLVRELLKPMIKEWLDANLPQIVEEKVEAEVQRIARLAR